MRCPSCQTEAAGAFCPACGAPLQGAHCSTCDAELVAGARFCTSCGAPVRPAPSHLPWYIAGAALIALIVALLYPALSDRAETSRGDVVAPAFAPNPMSAAPPPLTGTPREQADRLFNRVMTARESGDTAQASFFLPMAITAYEQMGELEADGLYHLGVLRLAAGKYSAAREAAEHILAGSADHLLGLALATDAAERAGERARAREYARRFLAAYERERGKRLPEYQDHAAMLPEYYELAQRLSS